MIALITQLDALDREVDRLRRSLTWLVTQLHAEEREPWDRPVAEPHGTEEYLRAYV